MLQGNKPWYAPKYNRIHTTGEENQNYSKVKSAEVKREKNQLHITSLKSTNVLYSTMYTPRSYNNPYRHFQLYTMQFKVHQKTRLCTPLHALDFGLPPLLNPSRRNFPQFAVSYGIRSAIDPGLAQRNAKQPLFGHAKMSSRPSFVPLFVLLLAMRNTATGCPLLTKIHAATRPLSKLLYRNRSAYLRIISQ